MPIFEKLFYPVKNLSYKATRYYHGHPLRVLSACLKTVFFCHVFNEYAFSLNPCRGASMLPTFEVLGDTVLVSKHYRRGRDIKVGDLVSFHSVVDPNAVAIKRVMGLAGDYVMRDSPESGSDGMIQIPEGHCWVCGDNLPYSRDSRHFGPMPMALIKGKVIAKVFPWHERRWIQDGLQPAVQVGI